MTSNSSFKKWSKQPITKVERKERKALNLKKWLVIILEKKKRTNSSNEERGEKVVNLKERTKNNFRNRRWPIGIA